MVKIYEKTFVEVSHTIGTITYYKMNKVQIEVLNKEDAIGYDKIVINNDYNLVNPVDIGKFVRVFETDLTFNEKVRYLNRHSWTPNFDDVNYGNLTMVV